jgi:hypothetical protein
MGIFGYEPIGNEPIKGHQGFVLRVAAQPLPTVDGGFLTSALRVRDEGLFGNQRSALLEVSDLAIRLSTGYILF